MKLLVLLAVAALLCAPSSAVFNNTEGIPYVQVIFTRAGGVEDQLIKQYVLEWAKGRSEFSVIPGGPTIDNIITDNLVSAGTVHTVEVAVWGGGVRNVEAIPAMQAFVTDALAGTVFPADFVVTSAIFHENPGPIVFNFDDFDPVYFGQESEPLRAFLTQAPPVGTTVSFDVRSNLMLAYELDTSILTFTYPATEAFFKATAKYVAAAADVLATIRTTAPTTMSPAQLGRVTINGSIASNLLQVTAKETVQINGLTSSLKLYDNQYSPGEFQLRVPRHNDDSFNLLVTPVFEPDNMTASPINVSVTHVRQFFTFKVRGPVGNYNLSFVIPPAFNDSNGNLLGENNDDFNPITTVLALEVLPRLVVSFSTIADSYMSTPVSSDSYGGAYGSLTVTLGGSPNHDVSVVVTPPDNMDVTPLEHTFTSGGNTMFEYQLRSHVLGIREVEFSITGTSRGDYFLQTATRQWQVHGRNPNCGTPSTAATCFAMNGCLWSQDRGRCFNSSLPMAIDTIPLLYSTEPSPTIKVQLPTPVRSDLRVVFTSMSHFTISPDAVALTAGDQSFTFVITGVVSTGDADLVTETIWMRLQGTDANTYTEERVPVSVRPRIACTLQPPINGFFVLTFSDVFKLTCDKETDVEVIFTPRTTTAGIVFQPETPDSRDPLSLFFGPGQKEASFYANSTSDRTGTVSVTVDIAGVNAPRYSPIPVTTFRVLEAGVVNLPPRFYLLVGRTSNQYHLDISVRPPTLLNVTASVFDEAGAAVPDDVVTVLPNPVPFNNTMRSTFNITATVIGEYHMKFAISGQHEKNYAQPDGQVNFTVKDSKDGPASSVRLTPGYLSMRRRCRMNVGLRSTRFRGQEPVELPENTCADITPKALANATVDCGVQDSSYKCRSWTEQSGDACAWVNETCMHFPQLQGQLETFQFGSGFTVFLDKNGTVWTTGTDRYGQLGHKGTDLAPVALPTESLVVVIACGSNHVLVLTAEGTVFAWGANHQGQLGVNLRDSSLMVPHLVSFPSTYDNITCVSSGFLHAAAVSTSGQVFTWGSNEFGQLGLAEHYRESINRPRVLSQDVFRGDPVQTVQLGEYHSMVATDSSAYTCGNNNQGQLGREGFDDFNFKPPVLWVPNKYVAGPTWDSYVTGRQC